MFTRHGLSRLRKYVVALSGSVALSLLVLPQFIVRPGPTASCGDLVIDAGPNRAIDLPATDVSLFGHVTTNPGNDPYSVAWTQTAGPSAQISGSWSTRPTVTVTTAGTYTFQMQVADVTVPNCLATTTVTVAAAAAKIFYIDTDYTGGANDGSAPHPWTSLVDGDGQQASNWTQIRNALATGDVYVYFAARHCGGAGCTGGDTPEQLAAPLRILRMCRTRPTSTQINLTYCTAVDTTTPNLLTLDGMSQYNSGTPTVPVWSNYTETAVTLTSNTAAASTVFTCSPNCGNIVSNQAVSITGVTGSVSAAGSPTVNAIYHATLLSPTTFSIPVNVTVGGTGGSAIGVNRFTINCALNGPCHGSFGIGNDDNNFPLSRDYLRVRGFEITGDSARPDFRGSYNDWEYINLHDETFTGPGFIFNNAITDFHSPPDSGMCVPIDDDHYIGLRHLTINNVLGEGIYIGGTYDDSVGSPGCPPAGGWNPPLNTDLLEENNHIIMSGQNSDSEEGNCMDMKSNWQHVTMRFNDCDSQLRVQEGCASWQGAFNDINEDYVIENNHFHGNEIIGNCIDGIITNGVTIRNNLIEGNFGRVSTMNSANMISLIKQPKFATPSYDLPFHHVRVYNNTIVNTTATAPGTAVCIEVGSGDPGVAADDIVFRNNVCVANGNGNQIVNGNFGGGLNTTNYSSDFNLFADSGGMACGTGSDLTEGSNSLCRTATNNIFVNLNSDWHLSGASPAVGSGVNLSVFGNLPSLAELFKFDFASAGRQASPTKWDMGAYRF